MGSVRVPILCLLAFLVIHTNAEKCTPSSCFSTNKSPHYNPQPGQQFTYDFESTATAQLVNKETVDTSVSIRGQAVISVGENCGYSLQLQNVIASGADNTKSPIKDFTSFPVEFTLSGDELLAEICADDKDSIFSLNLKRGLISAFQNSVGKSSELDIFGSCPVTSFAASSGGVTTITRQRDLDKCAYREKIVNGLVQGITSESSDIKSTPILNGKVDNEAKFQDGILQSTEIRETYNYLPFSTAEHGAKAKVLTKLTLKKTASGAGTAPKTPTQRSILFANTKENLASAKVKDSIKSAFDKALKEFTGQNGRISASSATAFADLIRLMRLAKRSDLTVSYQTMKSGNLSPLQSTNKGLSRSLFLDALFRVGTGDSVAALVDLSKKEFDDKERNLMYLSFNLVTSVTKEAITELTKLFKDNLPKEAYLSIGSIVNKYCRERGCEAADIKPISDKFIAKIPKDCVTKNRKEEEHLVSVLKGIRNSQTILNSALNQIISCVNSARPIRVRVATLQAFTANPCNKKLQQAAITVMKNREEDSEVRIEAYLTAVDCPNGQLANEIQAMLDSETINQVGTFVSTHLDSIKASTDPKREAARHQFRNLRTSKKFPFDPRRYSFNREVSYAIDSLGLGSAVDTSVIYSQRSFLPRSMRVNVTGNLFGSSFNFLELSARQENLESVIERYFGPRGLFSRLSKQELYDAIKKEFLAFDRSKRALPQDLAQFDKSVKLSNEYNREPDVDVSLKVFGSELYFLSMSQNIPSTPGDFVKFAAAELQKGVDALKDFNYNFENHALWLDSEIVYPTALGLPFKLSLTGASAVKVDLSGSIDVKAIIENPIDSKVSINFSPAANIFLACNLGFSAYAFESGLEVAGTMYTNTGGSTNIELQGGTNFVVKTVPAIKNQYVAEFTHQITTVTQESGREAVKTPIPFTGPDQLTSMCFDQVEFLTGASYCFEMQSIPVGKPNEHALWPLYGSSRVTMRMEMADEITFKAELEMSESPTLSFYVDTPHNSKPRRSTLKLLSGINPAHYFAGFSLSAPIMTGPFEIEAKLGLVNEENQKKLYGHGSYQKQKYEYELGFRKQGNEIIPILKLNTDLSYISGKVVERKTAKGVTYALQTIRFGKDNYLTTVDGSIGIEGPKIISNLQFDISGKKVDLNGHLGYDKSVLETDVTLKSDSFPTANGKLKYDFKYGDKNFGNDLIVVWDRDLNSKQNRLEWSQLADWGGENCKIKNELTVGKFEANGKINGEFGKKIFNLDSGLNYQKSTAELKIDNKYSQKQPHDYETSVYAMANQKSIKVELSREIEGDSSKIKNKIELSTGLKAELNGKFSHKYDYRDADVSLQGTFLPAAKKDITKVTIMLKNTQRGHDGNIKVTVGKNEVASGESKLTYGNDVRGTLKGSIKDVVTVDGTYESKQGKGKGVINAALKDKKLRAETTFTIQKPTYDFTSDFYYDYEKDNSKKVSFSTKNKLTQNSLDSKNNVEVFSERYAFNVAASNEGKLPSGKQKANVEIQLPTGRRFTANVDREANLKDGKGNGKVHITATDELPNKQQRQAVIDVKMNDLNIQQSFFDFVGSIKYKDYDNKDAKVQLAMKNLQKDHFATANGGLNIDGTLLPNAIAANVKIDEYGSEHAIYSFDGKYGSMGDVVLSGKFYNADKSRPYSHEFVGTLNVPESKFKSLTVRSDGKVSEPADAEGVYGVSYTGSLEYLTHVIKLETDLNFSKTKGTGSAKLQLPKQPPIAGEFKFNCNQIDSGDVTATLTYGDNKKISTSLRGQMPDEKSINFAATLQGDMDKFKDISLNVDVKRPQDNSLAAKVSGKVDGEGYSLDYEHRASTEDPKFLVVMTCPKGHVSKILAEGQIVSPLKGKGTLVIEKLRDFDLTANIDGDLSTLNNFYVRGDVNCPLLKITNYEFDVHSKDAGGRSGIEYKVTRDGKHVISGTSDYTTKFDNGRTIIEGKSTIKLTDGKSDDVTFKIIRHVYERSRDGEVGFGGIVTVTMGPRNYASELKVTDKEFKTKYSGCAKKNTCTSMEARSNLEQQSLDGFKHNLAISVDLRQVGFPHEFGLKADTSRDGFKFSHTLDAYLQAKEKPEYRYNVFINPKEAGALLSTPHREIALDAVYKYPERFYGPYESTLSFYIDKRNKPQMKSELGFKGEINHSGTSSLTGKGDLKFTHPNVKPLRIGGEFGVNADTTDVNYKLEFDVFSNPMDMIVVSGKMGNNDMSGKGFNITNSLEIYSKGLDFNAKIQENAGLSFEQQLISYGYELQLPLKEFKFGAYAEAGKTHFDVSAVAFNEEVLKANAVYDMEKHDLNLEGSFRYLKSDPFISKATIHGLTDGSFLITKGQLLDVNGGYGIGKDIYLIVKGSGREVFNGKVALDTAHFLKTDYKVDDVEVKQISSQIQDQIKRDLQSADDEIKRLFDRVQIYRAEKIERIVKALPDYRSFNQQYSNEIQKMTKELSEDENIKKFLEIVTPVIKDLSETFGKISSIVGEQLEFVQKFFTQLYDEVNTAFNERILPELKKFYDALQALVRELIDQGVKLITAAFERAAKALKIFEEDFNKISQVFKDLTGGVFEQITNYVKEIIAEVKQLYEQLREQFKTLPGCDYVKEKYNEYFGGFTPIQAIAAVVEEIISTVMEFVPEQAKPFFNKLNSYIKKKFDGETVNDMEILKEIYDLLLQAVQAMKKEYVDTLTVSSTVLPFSFDALKRLPPFITNIRFSALKQLTQEPIISLKDLLYLYRPYAFNPAELLPPFTMHGEIGDGSHIFTFDGRHLTFPGECSYILARDFAEGNFSVVASMADGRMKSIIVSDKNGFIEVNTDTALKLRDKDAEFPIHDRTLHAWRDPYAVNLLTEFGAEVHCSADLKICHVRVSGFYAGKTRGLMGNGNGEPYDDYLMPDGKITENTADLGNAYKTQKQCQAVSKSGDHHPKSHSNDFCSEYFGRDSSLRLGFLFVNPTNYREACEHATHDAKNAQEEACKIASVYASRCRQEFIPVSIPKACTQCTIGSQKIDIGDEVSVKVPQKQADIVIVFDTAVGKDLSSVTEIVAEIRRELKTQGINDVNVAAIGYNANDKYSSQYTSKGKLNFVGRFENLKGTGVPEDETVVTGTKEVDDLVAEIDKAARQYKEDLSVSPDARAFQKALTYPFRPTATKTILAVRSNGIPYSVNPSKLATAQISIEITSKIGIQVHSLMPVKITEPADKAKNIVGFNSNVALLINEKKRANMGSVEINNKLKYETDMGVDLTRQRGYVFNLNNYATDKKKFVSVVGFVLADSIARTEVISECRCGLERGIYAETKCIAKETQLLAPRKGAARG